jgi:uncharacterized membrane protein YdbT with pleckstrin-like domain
MYNLFRSWCEQVLRIPPDPEPPPGDEATALVFRAAPNYYKYLLAVWVLTTAGVIAAFLPGFIGPAAIGAAVARKHQGLAALLFTLPVLLLSTVAVMRLASLALVRLNFEKRWYLVTDRSLRVREGIVLVREMTVTFANIQNISISQGPIQRAIGIADLRVDTAGGGGGDASKKNQGQNLHTAWFRGVDNANEIRELIQERLRRLKDSGLGDPDELHQRQHAISAADPQVLAALRDVAAEASALRGAVETETAR